MKKRFFARFIAAAAAGYMIALSSASVFPQVNAAEEMAIRDKWGYCKTANYVESEHDPNGRYYYCDGDGHEENEVWFGYWYNKTDDGEDVLNIQWLGYGDYYSGHICQYSKNSDAIISGDTYSAAISLAINGNSRTCFIYGKEYSNYKPETLKVEKTSKTPTSMIGADQVVHPVLLLLYLFLLEVHQHF